MIDPYLEAEYNNSAKVPNSAALVAPWPERAAAFRDAWADKSLGLAYGPSERQALDLFRAPGGGPVAMFIHGGYWQRLDRSWTSHLAAGLLARGITVAMPSYDLCPHVSLAALTEQLRVAARFVAAHCGRLDLVTGHSAGGHLAAMLLADRLVPAAVPISGLFDLRPLVQTTVNDGVRMDEAEAWRLSPLALPSPGGRLIAVVGDREGPEYHGQSLRLADKWDGDCLILPNHDHFTIVDELLSPDSTLVQRCVDAL